MKNHLIFCLLLVISACTTDQPVSEVSLLSYVDTYVGTGPSTVPSALKHGHGTELLAQTFPAVGPPFSMTNWTPQTRESVAKCVSPYYYNDGAINGFRASHWTSGSCTQDYGSVSLMPISDPEKYLSKDRADSLDHALEVSAPDYYSIELPTHRLKVELTGKSHAGIFKIKALDQQDVYLAVEPNVNDNHAGFIEYDATNNELRGSAPAWRIYQGWGQDAGFLGHFVIQFQEAAEWMGNWGQDQKLDVATSRQDSIDLGGLLKLQADSKGEVLFKVGMSFSSIDQARKNLEAEISDWNFAGVRQATAQIWETELGKIQVEGDEAAKKTFYTALYHAFFHPREFSDVDGTYPGFADDTLLHKADGFVYYEDYTLWDTYRGLHPLQTILNPDRTRDMVRSLVAKAEQGGWLPIFPSWNNYTAAMIGDHAATFISDAYLKGVTDFDTETAFKYMYQNATQSPATYQEYLDGKGRRALDAYLKYGYIPMEEPVKEAFHKNEQVSRTLEYAFDDHALGQFAKALGKEEAAEVLLQRAQNYRKIFDPETKFMRGKHEDGRWYADFDPLKKSIPYTEGTAWQYSWYVPQDVEGLIELHGGEAAFISKLDSTFDIEQYWHGNEPGHQIPYMYNYAKRPDKSYQRVQNIMREEYGNGPGGLSGNDDSGQMSAWYVFAAVGMYPVCPGKPEYALIPPAFEQVKLALPNGKQLVIKDERADKAVKDFKWKLNGEGLKSPFLSHTDLMTGGELIVQ